MGNSSKKTIKLTTLRPLKSHLLKNNKGFSLVSILVASGIGVFLMSNVLDSQVTSTKIYSKITTANKHEWAETLMKEIISRDGYVDPDDAGPLTNIKDCLKTLNEKIKLDDGHEFRVKYHDENDALINPQPTDPDNPDTAEYFDPATPPDTAVYYYISEYDGENFKDRPSVKIVDNKCEVVGSGDVECYNVDDTGKTRVGCEDESATDEMLAEILKQPVTFGFNAGKKDGVGDYNTFVGNAAGQNTTGKWNSFFGYGAGLSNLNGSRNVFFGYEAGKRNKKGYDNTFVGYQAGMMNIGAEKIGYWKGSYNTFVGAEAGKENTEGKWNSFFGYQAGMKNIGIPGDGSWKGSGNSFFGAEAGKENISGIINSFFGHQAGKENTTGSGNSFFGAAAGKENTIGRKNSFFGYQAGMKNIGIREDDGDWKGSRNSFFGYQAGLDNTTGFDNTFVGLGAGEKNEKGKRNTFVGLGAGLSNLNGSYNVFVGYDAGWLNKGGDYNSFFGYKAGRGIRGDWIRGSGNSFFGHHAGLDNTTGSHNIYIGYKSGCSNPGTNPDPGLTTRPCRSASNNIYIGAIKPKDNEESNQLNIAGVIRATEIGGVTRDPGTTKIILRIGDGYCELGREGGNNTLTCTPTNNLDF